MPQYLILEVDGKIVDCVREDAETAWQNVLLEARNRAIESGLRASLRWTEISDQKLKSQFERDSKAMNLHIDDFLTAFSAVDELIRRKKSANRR